MEKAKIILKEYDKDNKIITMDIIDNEKHIRDCKKEGMTVEEFKKLVRSKYGEDGVIIENKIKKNRQYSYNDSYDKTVVKDERYDRRDIMDAMRNDSMTSRGLPKV